MAKKTDTKGMCSTSITMLWKDRGMLHIRKFRRKRLKLKEQTHVCEMYPTDF